MKKVQRTSMETCDRCCFDIKDEDGDIIEHYCIDNELYLPPIKNLEDMIKNKILSYAKKHIEATAEENGIMNVIIVGDDLSIEMASGKTYQLSEGEVNYQAKEYLESELQNLLHG